MLTAKQRMSRHHGSLQERPLFCEAASSGAESDPESRASQDTAVQLGIRGSEAVQAEITTHRCTIRDVPGPDAHLLADTLISLGAQSARCLALRMASYLSKLIEDKVILELKELTIVPIHSLTGCL